MSGHYGDMIDDLAGYCPNELPLLSEENLRYNIARANKAEAQLAELRKTLSAFKRMLERV